MKLGTIKQIVKEELSRFEKLPAWVDPLLQTLNNFIVNTAQALNGRLTFKDNFLCAQKSMKLTHGVEAQINPGTRFKVMGAACFSAGGLVVDKFGWRQLSNGNIGVTIYFDTGTTATCTVVIFFE